MARFVATVDRARLLEAAKAVMGASDIRNTVPVLANALITADGDAVTIECTDMEVHASVEIGSDAPTVNEGAASIPVKALVATLTSMSGAEVTLSQDEGGESVKIESGGAVSSLQSLPAADFPIGTRHADGFPASFWSDSLQLASALDRVRYAISTEETRYYLNGINVEIERDSGAELIRFVTTDGHRLASTVCEHLEAYGIGLSDKAPSAIILPRVAVGLARKLLPVKAGKTVPVYFGFSETRAQFKIGRTTITTKLIDGTFPDYRRVIPRENPRGAAIAVKPFLAAVKLVSAISQEKTKGIRLAPGVAEDCMMIACTAPGSGTSAASCESVLIGDLMPEIGFNGRYLKDCLEAMDCDAAVFRMLDGNCPMSIHDPDRPLDVHVLMPMRV